MKMDEHGPDVPEVTQDLGDRRVPRFDEEALRRLRERGHGQIIIASDEEVPPVRRYLPTFAELVDRMTIVQLKAIFIPENKAAYDAELALILHDVGLLLAGRTITAETIRAIAVLMLTNRVIWENESIARQGGSDQDKRLKFTHAINGVRNTAKNILARAGGERVDLKVDSLAADMPIEFGEWRDIFK